MTPTITTFAPDQRRALTLLEYKLWDSLNGPLAAATIEVPSHWDLAAFAKLHDVRLDTLIRYAIGKLIMSERLWCNCSGEALADAAAQFARGRPTPDELRNATCADEPVPPADDGTPTRWERLTIPLPPEWPSMLTRFADKCRTKDTPRDAERGVCALAIAALLFKVTNGYGISTFRDADSRTLDEQLTDEAVAYTTEPRLSEARIWLFMEPLPTSGDPRPPVRILPCNPSADFPFAKSLRGLASRIAAAYYKSATDGRAVELTARRPRDGDVIESVIAVGVDTDDVISSMRGYADFCWQSGSPPDAEAAGLDDESEDDE